MGTAFHFRDENILESDSGDGYITLCIYRNPRIVHFKTVNLMACELYLDEAVLNKEKTHSNGKSVPRK